VYSKQRHVRLYLFVIRAMEELGTHTTRMGIERVTGGQEGRMMKRLECVGVARSCSLLSEGGCGCRKYGSRRSDVWK
jgi:hypothetical protein